MRYCLLLYFCAYGTAYVFSYFFRNIYILWHGFCSIYSELLNTQIMARAKKFNGHLDIMEEIPVVELMRLCKIALSQDLSAVVTIRQTEGTDFPPFISIESQEFHDKTDNEGVFINQLN